MSNRLYVLCGVLLVLALGLCLPFLTSNRRQNSAAIVAQQLDEAKTKTDAVRSAMRYLARMTPLNRDQISKEVLLQLNTWIQTADRTSAQYSAPQHLQGLPEEMLAYVGCKSPFELEYSNWDIDYLFERRLFSRLSQWIVDSPLRDSLVSQLLEKDREQLSAEAYLQLEEACKLFDWATRNISLDEEGSTVTEKVTSPEKMPFVPDGTAIGYGYLAWESVLFSRGDFVEKGRVFTSLATQRGIPTSWILVDGNVWAVGVLIADRIYVFEPKLALPIPEPDEARLATLKEVQSNSRILRRLDLPGQFDYAFNPGEIEVANTELVIDQPPVAFSVRMKMLEAQLLGDERMVLYDDLDQLVAKFEQAAPNSQVRLWTIPLMAQVSAGEIRGQLRSTSPFTISYMAKHGIWMVDNPAARGRLMHVMGEFESSLQKRGSLETYMETRDYDEERIKLMAISPDLQKEFGVARFPGEDPEMHGRRVQQAQAVFRKAKADVAFLMAQLHFDRGDYKASANWFSKRVISVIDSERDNMAAQLAKPWSSIARFGLARAYQELGDYESCAEQLTYRPPLGDQQATASAMEPGNRLRLRYIRNLLAPTENDEEQETAE